ncbi:MAG: hypothetical protein M3443_01050 [Actinomycetota bacterium]|nr:hypothetical protein [Actinomycetota bacterium]
MTDLVPYDRRPRRSDSRQLSRALGTLDARSRMEAARIEAAAEVQALRTDAIGYVAKRGLVNAGMITKVEESLATLVPLASGRLAAIGDLAALAIADVVSDTARRMR